MAEEIELIACPFCGGPASFALRKIHDDNGNITTTHFVNCTYCGANTCGCFNCCSTRKDAALKWNKRVVEGEDISKTWGKKFNHCPSEGWVDKTETIKDN